MRAVCEYKKNVNSKNENENNVRWNLDQGRLSEFMYLCMFMRVCVCV